eukprot:9483364-Pyramimonas_sp.AAC.1
MGAKRAQESPIGPAPTLVIGRGVPCDAPCVTWDTCASAAPFGLPPMCPHGGSHIGIHGWEPA